MKKIVLLGSTGSIGAQTLEVIQQNKDKFAVSALTCGSNVELLGEQIKRFQPEIVSVLAEKDARTLQERFPKMEILWGEEGLTAAVEGPGDVVVNGLVGIRGLIPTLAAIAAGKDIALANKETLVTGGELVTRAAAEKDVRIFPLDSEHNAIFQCLQGEEKKALSRILLTASGGPFRNYASEALEHVKLEQVLRHPKWKMGKKITVDSATLMNKGLEVIEARWLFDVPLSQIEVLVHPQSIVHSMVEFQDGCIMAQLGAPDMRIPIAYALHYPHREYNSFDKLNFFREGANLTFEQADDRKFRALKLAYEAGKKGGTYPVVLNGANEMLVKLFLEKKIKFTDIGKGLERIMDFHVPKYDLEPEDILEADGEARRDVLDLFGGVK